MAAAASAGGSFVLSDHGGLKENAGDITQPLANSQSLPQVTHISETLCGAPPGAPSAAFSCVAGGGGGSQSTGEANSPTLSAEQQNVLDLVINDRRNVFFTGKRAGWQWRRQPRASLVPL